MTGEKIADRGPCQKGAAIAKEEKEIDEMAET